MLLFAMKSCNRDDDVVVVVMMACVVLFNQHFLRVQPNNNIYI